MELYLGRLENDRLFGSQAQDMMLALSGDDTLMGSEGNDYLNGNQGEDLVSGNEGDDTLHGGQDDDTLQGGENNDLIYGDKGNDVIFGDSGNDTARGGEGNDRIFGNAQNNLLNGNQGNDTVVGGVDNDIVRGGKDNDEVFGAEGNDTLYGDLGSDTLIGGSGDDRFVIGQGTGGSTIAAADLITDFGDGADAIELSDGLTFEELNIFQGVGEYASDTIIQHRNTGEYLAVLQGIDRTQIEGGNETILVLGEPKPNFSDNSPNSNTEGVTIVFSPDSFATTSSAIDNIQAQSAVGDTSPGGAGKPANADFRIDMSQVPGFNLLDRPAEVAEGLRFLGTGPSPTELRLVVPFNANAADTTNADRLREDGDLGLNLSGAGVTVAVWDGGKVRNTHQEFGDRVSFGDSSSAFDDHATHIAGTIGAAGVETDAAGMADRVSIVSYDAYDDLQEIAADADELNISNHSYGPVVGWDFKLDWGIGPIDTWLGDRSLPATQSPQFGQYNNYTREIDRILYDNPNLLSIWAAGNERQKGSQNRSRSFGDRDVSTYVTFSSAGPAGPGWYQVMDDSAGSRPEQDGGESGYNSLPPGGQTAKNTLVVGAIEDITADPYDGKNAAIADFSSWGPTDDGRIRPDVVANGVGVYSTIASSDTAYATFQGTSMAAPNVAGTAALLYEHYNDLFDSFPNSATGKGLLIHTAADAGNVGPDYAYGWGVVDAAEAANFLTNASRSNTSDLLFEEEYTGSETTIEVNADGNGSLKATLVWLDPAAGDTEDNEFERSPSALVNDLDLSIVAPDGTTYYPWTLDPANPSSAAVRTEKNHRDNVEQVLIDAPEAGTYTIYIGHTGSSFDRDYSLLVSSAGNIESDGNTPTPTPDNEEDDRDRDPDSPTSAPSEDSDIVTLSNPTLTEDDDFGDSVAIAGNSIVVGAPYDDTNGNNAGIAYLFDASTGNLLQTLNNPSPDTDDAFGESVAIADNFVLVGAPFEGQNSPGAAYLFDSTNGNLVQTFNNPTPDAGDFFGASVAIAGNAVAIGSNNAGAAYLFDATSGDLVRTFTDPTPEDKSDRFGSTVAIADRYVLVGAPFDNTGDNRGGAVYLFDTVTGDLLQTFSNPSPEQGDEFGSALAIADNYILIGAPFDSTGAANTGSAYLFERSNGKLLQTFNNPNPDEEDFFGFAVTIVGDRIFVGAPYDDMGATNAGVTYQFDATNGNLLETLSAPIIAEGNRFGDSVAIANNTLLVGAPGKETVDSDTESAFLFTL